MTRRWLAQAPPNLQEIDVYDGNIDLPTKNPTGQILSNLEQMDFIDQPHERRFFIILLLYTLACSLFL